ncbi:MAG: hypothetical protein GKR91_07445 [Pseudomonadales bacterium]|nr:hypothetical protein [Pseudomonadales bacterium]
MRILKFGTIALVMVILGFSALLFLAPAIAVVPLTNFALGSQGLKIREVTGLNLGASRISLESAVLEGIDYEAELSSLNAEYALFELLAGRAKSLEIENLLITTGKSESASDNSDPIDLEELRAQFRDIPVELINVASINLQSPGLTIDGNVSITGDEIDLESVIQLDSFSDWQFSIALNSENLEQFTGNLKLFEFSNLDQELLDSEFSGAFVSDGLLLTANSRIGVAELSALTDQFEFVSGLASASNELQVATELQVSGLSSSPNMDLLSNRIDSESEEISIQWQFDPPLSGALSISLPISIAINHQANENYRISLTDTAHRLAIESSTPLSINGNLQETSLTCESFRFCRAEGKITATAAAAEIAQLVLEQTSITGDFSLAISESGIRLAPSQFEANIENINYPPINSSVSLTLNNVVAAFTDDFRASASIVSDSLSLNGDGIALINPDMIGSIEFENNQVDASLILGINNQVDTGILLTHNLDSNQGGLGIELRSFQLSNLVPLSSLISQSYYPGDLVQGQISGGASLEWQLGEEASQFAGPLNLELQSLSGFVNETFFVDLNAAIDAQFTSPFGVRSSGEQSATIATVDTGLPIEEISWNFDFDTANSNYNLSNLDSQVLGGKIGVSEFNYDIEEQEQELEIVLTSLDLETIVALADYPGIDVNGLISGYLPISISGNSLTIEQGLVGALNPGGIIRYSPANPVPSSNPSVQLVNDALSNYNYETMNTEVYYDENGDLRMEVQLQGINPDMNSGQPINLNVNITDNIPTLLRSLRASRVITDALEESLTEQ